MARLGFEVALASKSELAISNQILRQKDLLLFRSVMDEEAAGTVLVGDMNFDLRDKTFDRNVLSINKPVRALFLLTGIPIVEADVQVTVKIIYDIVTLSTQEQAELFLSGQC